MTDRNPVAVQYSLPDSLPEWELPEVPVPESPEHDRIAERLTSVLRAGLVRAGRPGVVHRNLAIRWDRANPRVGVDPDVCWVAAPPLAWPSEERWDSLRLWLTDGSVPPLAVEIVSSSHPYKDYARVQDKYAVIGVEELWVYDPSRFGPRSLGGPVLLQLWRRTPAGVLTRRHFGDGPAYSELLDAWLLPKARDHLVIAADREGRDPWPSPEEEQRARADQAWARVEELEAELQRRRERR